MSVLRTHNWLGQARVDTQHLRMLESGIAADFDLLAGQIMTAKKAVVLYGFNPSNITPGMDANALTINVVGAVMHYKASESGTIFVSPSDRTTETLVSTNVRVRGDFVASQTNYIGLDFLKSADSSTTDLVMFLDANTLVEEPKRVPLGRTMDYVITISTAPFASQPNVLPIAIVNVSGSKTITSITDVTDARNMFGRLGTGGTAPNSNASFSWGIRNETAYTFQDGDKNIPSLKDWMDASMSRIWETGGGLHWYSQTADRNVKLIRIGATFVSSNDHFEWDGTNVHWKGLRVLFENSGNTGIYYNAIADQTTSVAGLTNLLDGDCIFADLSRAANNTITLTALNKARLGTILGSSPALGQRWILLWRDAGKIYTRDDGTNVGDPGGSGIVATPTVLGVVRLSAIALTPASPQVASIVTGNSAAANGLTRMTGAAGTLEIGSTSLVDVLILIGQYALAGVTAGPTTSFTPFISVGNTLRGGTDTSQTQAVVNMDQLVSRDSGGPAGAARLVEKWRSNSGAGMVTLGWRESNGSVVTRSIPSTAAFFPTAPPSAHARTYFTDNGLATGFGLRYQYVVMWQDGSTTIIAESPPL